MQKKINNEIAMCAIEQQERLNGNSDNSHVITGIGFLSIIACINIFMLF